MNNSPKTSEFLSNNQSLSKPKSRREFLAKSTAIATGAAVAATVGGCTQEVREEKKAVRWGMVVDLKKCVGCKACVVACKAENHTPPGVSYNVVMEEEIRTYPYVRRQFLFRPCMQCANSSCVYVCPTEATYYRPDGIVAIDYDKCIGCRYCIAACPYGARDQPEVLLPLTAFNTSWQSALC